MSITAGPPQVLPENNHKKSSFHRRHDSGELDVFEAARYFSGANEISGGNFVHHQKMRGGRISLDLPMISSNSSRSSNIPSQTHVMEKPTLIKEKKNKQPNSPGGRLASFLNSLFSQSSSKKKKSKSCSAQSMKDEDEISPGWRRRRRSSISHFRSGNNNFAADSKSSFYSSNSSNSGFRSPPPYANTPTKNNTYKDFKSFLDQDKPVLVTATLSKNNSHVHYKSSASQKEIYHHHQHHGDNVKKSSTNTNSSWLDDQKFKFSTTSTTTTSTNGLVSSSEKYKNFGNDFLDGHDHHQNPFSERDFRNFINEMDDGADSDSSSDLFELQNYDLGCYSSGLPVYETTHMDSIKRSEPLTSCPI